MNLATKILASLFAPLVFAGFHTTQTLNMNHNFTNYQCAANTLFHQIIKVFPITKSREEFLEVCLALNERFFFLTEASQPVQRTSFDIRYVLQSYNGKI